MISKSDSGYSDVLVGLQYGDEGKAKIIDLLAPRYDVIVRFNGGANAGHTIYTDRGPLALRQLPSGVLQDNVSLYIGSGCAVNPMMLESEIAAVEQLGIRLRGRLFISSRAALVQPHHIIIDRLTGGTIGTTGNGIGPCYADRALRASGDRILALTMKDFVYHTTSAIESMKTNASSLWHRKGESAEAAKSEVQAALKKLTITAEILRPFVVNDDHFLVKQVVAGAKVLFEGAQSIGLDIVKGVVPYVTSSHTVPGFAYVGGDIPPRYHRYTIGIAKAIASRVGNGPFPGELGGERSADYCADSALTGRGRAFEAKMYDPDALLRSNDPFELGMALRMLTDEYGTGTGRPRRVGILDLVQLGEAVRATGADFVFLNKCDCLSIYKKTPSGKMPLVVSYGEDPVRSKPDIIYLDSFEPLDQKVFSFDELPPELSRLVDAVEAFIKCPILGVGLGPRRNDLSARLYLLEEMPKSVDKSSA